MSTKQLHKHLLDLPQQLLGYDENDEPAGHFNLLSQELCFKCRETPTELQWATQHVKKWCYRVPCMSQCNTHPTGNAPENPSGQAYIACNTVVISDMEWKLNSVKFI